MRRKGEISFSRRVREYPFASLLQVDHRTRSRQLLILDGIATRMTGRTPRLDFLLHLFRT